MRRYGWNKHTLEPSPESFCDNLSPLLFAIYLHDLEQFLRDKYGPNLLIEIQNQNNLPNEMETI